MSRPEKPSEAKFFSGETVKFSGVAQHAWLIGNKLGNRNTNSPRAMASWLFIRACVTAKSIERLFEPQSSGYGDMKYLDHASLAALSRCMIDTVTTLLYVGDVTIGDDEWTFRKSVIDLHDHLNRADFLDYINFKSTASKDEIAAELTQRVKEHPLFDTLPKERKKNILKGGDMFIEGRHAATLKLGWGDSLTRGVYKYLSHQTHSQSMAFQRTEANRLYERDSPAALAVAGFSVEFARKALGTGCVRMLSLFPDVEMAFNPIVLTAIKSQYTPTEE